MLIRGAKQAWKIIVQLEWLAGLFGRLDILVNFAWRWNDFIENLIQKCILKEQIEEWKLIYAVKNGFQINCLGMNV